MVFIQGLGMGEAAKVAAGALAGAVSDACAEPAAQLELVGVPHGREGQREHLTAQAEKHRRGRPKGAQNIATRDTKAFCRKVFGYDPMIEGFRWLQHTPETLSIVLGCTRAEAFDRLEALRRDLMRYFYAPMQPVDENGQPVPFFNVQIGGAQGAPGAAALPWIYPGGPVIEGEQNQPLSGEADAVSHGAKSHGDPK